MRGIIMNNVSFTDIAIVSCGTLSLELNYLKKEGFLDTSHLFFTTPGLHENIHELEAQLLQRINKAKEKAAKVLITSLNIEENREAAYRLNIHSIPTLVIFNDGEETRRFFGLQKADSLTKALEDALL